MTLTAVTADCAIHEFNFFRQKAANCCFTDAQMDRDTGSNQRHLWHAALCTGEQCEDHFGSIVRLRTSQVDILPFHSGTTHETDT